MSDGISSLSGARYATRHTNKHTKQEPFELVGQEGWVVADTFPQKMGWMSTGPCIPSMVVQDSSMRSRALSHCLHAWARSLFLLLPIYLCRTTEPTNQPTNQPADGWTGWLPPLSIR